MAFVVVSVFVFVFVFVFAVSGTVTRTDTVTCGHGASDVLAHFHQYLRRSGVGFHGGRDCGPVCVGQALDG